MSGPSTLAARRELIFRWPHRPRRHSWLKPLVKWRCFSVSGDSSAVDRRMSSLCQAQLHSWPPWASFSKAKSKSSRYRGTASFLLTLAEIAPLTLYRLLLHIVLTKGGSCHGTSTQTASFASIPFECSHQWWHRFVHRSAKTDLDSFSCNSTIDVVNLTTATCQKILQGWMTCDIHLPLIPLPCMLYRTPLLFWTFSVHLHE